MGLKHRRVDQFTVGGVDVACASEDRGQSGGGQWDVEEGRTAHFTAARE